MYQKADREMVTLDLCTIGDTDVHPRTGERLEADSAIRSLFEIKVCTPVCISLRKKKSVHKKSVESP